MSMSVRKLYENCIPPGFQFTVGMSPRKQFRVKQYKPELCTDNLQRTR